MRQEVTSAVLMSRQRRLSHSSRQVLSMSAVPMGGSSHSLQSMVERVLSRMDLFSWLLLCSDGHGRLFSADDA